MAFLDVQRIIGDVVVFSLKSLTFLWSRFITAVGHIPS